jgi:hypothetical protein
MTDCPVVLAKWAVISILLARGCGILNEGPVECPDESLRGGLFHFAVVCGFSSQGLYQVFNAEDDML